MPGIPIHLNRPPFSARLLLWGRALDGWWGLCAWSQTVRENNALAAAAFAAWLPAGSISRPGWAGPGSTGLARIVLSDDRGDWPAPASWVGWFAGAWPAGPVATPKGVQVVNGPAWRRQ